MQFGIFDQNDQGPYPLAEQYGHRLELIEFYDRAGFRTYHMSDAAQHDAVAERPPGRCRAAQHVTQTE